MNLGLKQNNIGALLLHKKWERQSGNGRRDTEVDKNTLR